MSIKSSPFLCFCLNLTSESIQRYKVTGWLAGWPKYGRLRQPQLGRFVFGAQIQTSMLSKQWQLLADDLFLKLTKTSGQLFLFAPARRGSYKFDCFQV